MKKNTNTNTTRKTNTNTTPTNTTNTFNDLVNRCSINPADPDALTDLATAVVYSVLRKVIDPTRKTAATADHVSNSGINPALVSLRTGLTRDRAATARLRYSLDNATHMEFNADGDPVSVVDDPALDRAAADLLHDTLSDGLDLVNDAVVAILAEIDAQKLRDPDMPTDLARGYVTRRLRRKVWIKNPDLVTAWEDVATTPIQEVFKAVRRSIENSRAVQNVSRYTYLADLANDPADPDGDPTVIYRRLPKYADMGGDVGGRPDDMPAYIAGQPAGLDGKPVNYSADITTVEKTDRLVAAMGLTDREMTVLKYRLAGYGYKAIATAMGITVDNAKRVGRRLRDKATANGLTPATAN